MPSCLVNPIREPLRAQGWQGVAVKLWIPAIGMAVLIFVLSSIPGTLFPLIDFPLSDKIVHASLFGVLAVTVAIPLHRMRPDASMLRIVLISTVLAILYGVTDELHQLFTPHRSSDVLDVLADATGGFLGSVLYMTVAARRHQRKRR